MMSCVGERLGVDGVTVQQQPERHPGRWDGSRQDYSDDRTHHVLDGEETCQRTVPYHCSSLVSTTPLSSVSLSLSDSVVELVAVDHIW